MRLSRFLLILVATGSLLSGCATMFHRGPAEVRIAGPDSMKIMTFDSTVLAVSGRNISQIVIPPRGSDSLLLEYRGKYRTAYLERQANPNVFLNLLIYSWPGFAVDDLSQTWFDYHYMTAIRDSNDNLHVFSGAKEQTGLYDRPRFFIMGGELFNWRSIQPATSSLVMPGGDMNFDFEAGAGLDLYNQMQVFFRTRSSISDYSYNYSYYDTLGSSYSIGGVNGVAIRLLRNRFFLEGSYNWSTITLNPYYYYGSQFYSPTTKDVTLIGAGIGFSGDITYIALEYLMEPRPFLMNGRAYSNRRLTLSYGVNWRF
jgi:hypothetical protein